MPRFIALNRSVIDAISLRTALLVAIGAFGVTPGRAQEIDFAHQIVPILRAHCAKCHAGSQKEGAFSINTRFSLMAGGESGEAIVSGNHRASELFLRVTSDNDSIRMPPEGDGLTEAQQKLLAQWIDSGLGWEEGFTFGDNAYEPPLFPRMPELPTPVSGRNHPIDRILDHSLEENGGELPAPVSEEVFLRRVYLDLIGLLPTPEEREEFIASQAPSKREETIRNLLSRNVDYAEHWLTFWNDLLRNDYTGTGFITGGRKQISGWLYQALVTNKPYDQFARELIAPPNDQSSGFADGIRWRGEVSAGQTVEIQYAQSVGQSFLGINLKCASCHDSFIDRWKLEDAYGLAAIYSTKPLELHRCDKPIGKQAEPVWLFPELGQVDAKAPREERLRQLADLMTDRRNGRFTRTIVNRIWHRLMGRGIVHPTDSMQSEPWNEDLLDFLAEDLAEHQYDLKRTIELISTSAAYQSKVELVETDESGEPYRYAGPRAKRFTAEQFLDAVWQLTGAGPKSMDAPIQRGDPAASTESSPSSIQGRWIWDTANSSGAIAGETVLFRKTFEVDAIPEKSFVVASCDNGYDLYLNGRRIGSGDNWENPDLLPLTQVVQGPNTLLVVAKNGGSGPNPAALFVEARLIAADGAPSIIASDRTWQCVKVETVDLAPGSLESLSWRPAVESEIASVWMSRLSGRLQQMVLKGEQSGSLMVRASLVKSDFLMRSLGRPNRDQIVSVRPTELTTLEAIDLSIGDTLSGYLRAGADEIVNRPWQNSEEMIRWMYAFALSRQPAASELDMLVQTLGPQPSVGDVEDLLWAVVMLPEFQIVR